MAHYTGEIRLSLEDLKRLRDKYNSAGEFTDRSFMNELFHGLDGMIDNIEQPKSKVNQTGRKWG